MRKLVPDVAAGLLMLLVCMPGIGLAQSWPQRPVSMLSGYPAGGVIDQTARLVSAALREKSNQQFTVFNKVGGAGMVAMTELMNAPPDGSTLLVNNDGGLVFIPAVDPNFKLDPFTAYTPIAQANQFTWAFVVNSEVAAKSLAEFVAYAKSRDLSYGSPGVGSVPHVVMERFARINSVKLTHIPYRGAAPSLTDLIAGVIPAAIVSMPVTIGQAGNPRLRVLAVFGPERIKELPDVPTMAELGLKDLEVVSYNAFFGPPNMPKDLAQEISRAIVDAVNTPASRERYKAAQMEPVAKDYQTFSKIYYDDVKRWKDFAIESNLRLSP